jgi:hypothetical protein
MKPRHYLQAVLLSLFGISLVQGIFLLSRPLYDTTQLQSIGLLLIVILLLLFLV